MEKRKRYEKPRIIESTKIEAVAGACAPSPPGKASTPSCTLIMS